LRFKFLLLLFFSFIIVLTLVGAYFYFQPESFSQIKSFFNPTQSISDYQKQIPSQNAYSEIKWVNETYGILHIYSAPINYYDDGWKSFWDKVHLQRDGKNLIIVVDNKFDAILRILPTLNNQTYTWTQVFNQYPNIKFDTNVFKSRTGIKFDLNLTNGAGMGVNMPDGAGLKIDLTNSHGITYNDVAKVDNGILFYDKFKLEIPSACMAEINKTTIWLHNLNETCLDPTIYLSQGWIREDGYIEDGTSRHNSGSFMNVGSPFGFVIDRGYMDFDTTLLPTNAQVNDVSINFTVKTACSSNGDIHHLELKAADQTDANLYTDIINGTAYISDDAFLTSVGNKQLDLGTTADSDLQNQNDTNFFGIGFKSVAENDNPVGEIYTSESTFEPVLIVGFTQSGAHIFPNVTFESPTPTDGFTTTINTHTFNLSIEEEGLESVKFNWNGKNDTYYDDNLILMLNFDDYTRLNDTSQTNHKVNSTGDASWVSGGKYGGAYEFDGTGDFLDLGNPSDLNLTVNFTVEVWVNDTHTGVAGFVLGRSSAGATSGGWAMVTASAGNGYRMRFLGSNGTSNLQAVSSVGYVINDSKWHHVVGTVNDTGIHIYVDGEWNGTRQTPTLGIIDSEDDFTIGTKPTKDGNFWNGMIDEVRIWKDTVWNITDVKRNYISNLYKYDSQKWVLILNKSNLDSGTYTYFGSVIDVVGNENITNTRTLTIGSGDLVGINGCTNLSRDNTTYYLTQSISNSNFLTCMNVTGNNVTLDCKGYTIDGLDTLNTYGIYSYGVSNFTVDNCLVTDWYYGIRLENTINSEVKHSRANSNPFAVYFKWTNDSIIRNTTMYDNFKDGINFRNSKNVTVVNVTISGTGERGIYIPNGNYKNIRIINSTVEESSTTGYWFDIFFHASSDNDCNSLMLKDVVSNGLPIEYYNSTSVFIENRTLASLLLCNVDGSRFRNITIIGSDNYDNNGIEIYRTKSANFSGINNSNNYRFYTYDSSELKIIDSAFDKSRYGIYIYNTQNSSFENCSLDMGSPTQAIRIDSNSHNNIFVNMSINASGRGLFISNAYHNTFTNSSIFGCDYGIYLYQDRNSSIYSNTIKNSSTAGIYLDNSGYNIPTRIYNNVFNQTNNFKFYGSYNRTNEWNITKTAGANIIGGTNWGGNVWTNSSGTDFSDTCTDADSDGICDAPYTLETTLTNIDYLPLATTGVVDTIPPNVSFVSPTPDDGLNSTDTSHMFNVSITESSLGEVKFNWNGTNTTYYDADLLEYYTFENMSALGENGTYVVDLTGRSNGTINNGNANWRDYGKYGGAYEFDGEAVGGNNMYIIDDFATVYDCSDFYENNYTVEFWVNGSNTKASLYGWQNTNARFSIWNDNPQFGPLVKSDNGHNNRIYIASSSVLDSTWHHFVFVKIGPKINSEGNDRWKLYLDGNEVSWTSGSNDTFNAFNECKNGYVGANNENAGPDDEFKGLIDNFKMWNRSLTAEEINQSYYSNLYKYDIDKWILYLNKSGLTYGNYTYFASAFDTFSNENMTSIRVLNISQAPATTPPYFTDGTPYNSEWWDNMTYIQDVNASDADEAVSCFDLNDTSIFSINCSGWLTNSTTLPIAVHWLNVSVNDTLNYWNSSIIYINVSSSAVDTAPEVTIIKPENVTYTSPSVDIEFGTNENSTCNYTFDNGIHNITMTANASDTGFTATNSSIADGGYSVYAYCDDTTGNYNYTTTLDFSIGTTTFNITTDKLYVELSKSVGKILKLARRNTSASDWEYYNISIYGVFKNTTDNYYSYDYSPTIYQINMTNISGGLYNYTLVKYEIDAGDLHWNWWITVPYNDYVVDFTSTFYTSNNATLSGVGLRYENDTDYSLTVGSASNEWFSGGQFYNTTIDFNDTTNGLKVYVAGADTSTTSDIGNGELFWFRNSSDGTMSDWNIKGDYRRMTFVLYNSTYDFTESAKSYGRDWVLTTDLTNPKDAASWIVRRRNRNNNDNSWISTIKNGFYQSDWEMGAAIDAVFNGWRADKSDPFLFARAVDLLDITTNHTNNRLHEYSSGVTNDYTMGRFEQLMNIYNLTGITKYNTIAQNSLSYTYTSGTIINGGSLHRTWADDFYAKPGLLWAGNISGDVNLRDYARNDTQDHAVLTWNNAYQAYNHMYSDDETIWGRGMGWSMIAFARGMDYGSSSQKAEWLDKFQNSTYITLISNQTLEGGWMIDLANMSATAGDQSETSGTGMISAGLILGYDKGYLNSTALESGINGLCWITSRFLKGGALRSVQPAAGAGAYEGTASSDTKSYGQNGFVAGASYLKVAEIVNGSQEPQVKFNRGILGCGSQIVNDTLNTKIGINQSVAIMGYANQSSDYLNLTLKGDSNVNITLYNLNASTTYKIEKYNSTDYISYQLSDSDASGVMSFIADSDGENIFEIESSGADITPPTCTLISQTPADIEEDSSGVLEVIINCSDASGVNASSALITRTVDGFATPGLPNYWSMRSPPNDNADTCPFCGENILLADGRRDGKWYDTYEVNGNRLFADNYSYAVVDNKSMFLTIDIESSTSMILNFSRRVETDAFRQNVYLSRGRMEGCEKANYSIYNNHGLIIKMWNQEEIRGNTLGNYTVNLFSNLWDGGSVKRLFVYFCNSSFDITGTTLPEDDTDNCVYLSSFDETILLPTALEWSSRNSSYIRSVFGINNGTIGGIKATEYNYLSFETLANKNQAYKFAMCNGSSGTEPSFLNSSTAWQTDGATPEFINYTADNWYGVIKSGDEFQLGIYIEDNLANNVTNFTFIMDEIGDVNHPITYPAILHYCQGTGETCLNGEDWDLNKTYNKIMAVHVGIALDPDSIGQVNHTLTLMNTDYSFNSVINASIVSVDDSDVHVDFDTSSVADGNYKMNISAQSNDDATDIKEYVTVENFTIDNTAPPTYVNASPQLINIGDTTTVNFTIYDDLTGVNYFVFNITSPSGVETYFSDCTETYPGACTLSVEFGTSDYLSEVGYYNVSIWVNDTLGNWIQNTTWYYVNDTIPPNVTIVYPESGIWYGVNISELNYTIVDDDGLSRCWYSIDDGDTNSSTADAGLNFTNIHSISATQTWTLWCNDSSNNVNITAVTFSVDYWSPYFTGGTPINMEVYDNETAQQNVTGADAVTNINCYTLNDTTIFSINCSGYFINTTEMPVAIHWLNVSVNDSLNNWNSSIIYVNVSSSFIDTNIPWFTNMANFNHTVNTSFSYDFNADDLTSAIDCFSLNDTTNFNITCAGVMLNQTALNDLSKMFWFNITVNDTEGNMNSSIFYINITEAAGFSINITITTPINTSYSSSQSELNVTVEGTNLNTYWYSLDDVANVTYIPNISLHDLGWEAWHVLRVWVNDTSGNEATDMTRFYIGKDPDLDLWIMLFIIFSIMLILGIVGKNEIFIFTAGTLIGLMGIWIFNSGITVYGVSEYWIYPLGWIFVGLSIILTIASSLSFINEMAGGKF